MFIKYLKLFVACIALIGVSKNTTVLKTEHNGGINYE